MSALLFPDSRLSYKAVITNNTAPIKIVAGIVIAISFFITSPSLPRILAVVVPRIILLGLIAAPMAPPAYCAPGIAAVLAPRSFAVVIWKLPNKILELMLLPVINVPRSPTNGAKIM